MHAFIVGIYSHRSTTRWHRTVLGAITAVLSASPAWASGLTVPEPTIIGPLGPVHHVANGGFAGGYDWVSAQGFGEPEVDGALWEAGPLAEGPYEVEAWMPSEPGEADARYRILHENITSEVLVSQYEVESGAWIKLGAYEFNGEGASVRSTDAAGDPKDRIDWADMRWTSITVLPPRIEVDGTTTTVREPTISGSEAFVSRFAGVGYGGSLWVALAQGEGEPSIDSATWAASLASGEYAVQVFIPESHHEAEVSYTIHADEGDRTFIVEQPRYKNTWVTLGDVRFHTGTAEATSSDATGEPNQDIAWSALRFEQIKTIPEGEPETDQAFAGAPQGVVVPAPSQQVLPSRSSHSPALLPLVPGQRKLILFISNPLSLGSNGPVLGRNYSFRIVRAKPEPKILGLRYRCLPCLLVADQPKLRPGTDTPMVTIKHWAGSLSALIGRLKRQHMRLFQGSVLRVEVTQFKHRSRVYLYRLADQPDVKRPIECGPTIKIPACRQ